MTVISDQSVLDGFVTPGNGRRIPLALDDGIASTVASGAPPASRFPSGAAPLTVGAAALTFQLTAEVAPPLVSGQALQATHIVQKGNEVYVAYAMIGEPTLGAVDVFTLERNVPRLLSRATFTTTEYYAVEIHGSDLFLVGSTSDSGFTDRAVLDVVDVSRKVLPSPLAAIRLQLPSYAGTGVSADGKYVWVTSGSGGPNVGGLSIYDKKKLALVDRIAFLDARGVFS
ncbi:MAG TPA: hypothetical protein VFV33_25870, partial [Gemmatimonadaceae bacterium]|nr:hypothetical protein [Gemmatimonadaceae bacterium]